jgi:hypothetical protein
MDAGASSPALRRVAVRNARSLVRSFRAKWTALWPVTRWGIFAGALVYCLLVLTGFAQYGNTPPGDVVMGDAAAYYFVDTPYDWTDRAPGVGEYRYSPTFLGVTAPLRILPWEAFAALWFAAHIGVLLYLRLPWMLVFPGVLDDAVRGNVNTFLALAAVLIVTSRGPWWPAFFLTKVTPGFAIVWHAGRREWKQMAIGISLTGLIVVLGVAVNAELWRDWLLMLAADMEAYPVVTVAIPLTLRLVAAAVVCLYAATANRPWLLPVGMLLAMPAWWFNAFAILLASVALYLRSPRGLFDAGGAPAALEPPPGAASGSNTAASTD